MTSVKPLYDVFPNIWFEWYFLNLMDEYVDSRFESSDVIENTVKMLEHGLLDLKQ